MASNASAVPCFPGARSCTATRLAIRTKVSPNLWQNFAARYHRYCLLRERTFRYDDDEDDAAISFPASPLSSCCSTASYCLRGVVLGLSGLLDFSPCFMTNGDWREEGGR